LIERRIDSDDPVFLLDGAEDKIFFGTLLATTAPPDFVTAHAAAKISFVQSVENGLQVKVEAFMPQIELPLHGQPRMSQFTLSFFRHRSIPYLN
jgi:hypothetical protein